MYTLYKVRHNFCGIMTDRSSPYSDRSLPDQYPGTDRLTFANLSLALRRVVVPRLLDQYDLHYQRPLLERVVQYQYIDSVPAGSQQLLLASFIKVSR